MDQMPSGIAKTGAETTEVGADFNLDDLLSIDSPASLPDDSVVSDPSMPGYSEVWIAGQI